MNIETLVVNALSGLAGDRIFPDQAEEGTPAPYIVYQQVGGDAVNYTEASVPDTQNGRIQVSVWAARRLDASDLGKQVEDALRLFAGLQVTVLGARRALFDPITKLRGTMQDFSVWAEN